MKNETKTLTHYLDLLQSKGRYSFTRDEALIALGNSPEAFKLAASRLIKKKRLMRPKQGFYVIVPTEYQNSGVLPPAWFIDNLMKFYQLPYYVGSLSAAALHGAAHQQPQIFQVVTTKPLRSINIGQIHIKFIFKKQIISDDYESVKTPTGYMHISIPEITAYDLLKYVKSAGHLNNVTTILSELHEKFDLKRLTKILKTENLEIPHIQRLGYLLEFVNAHREIINSLKQWIQKQKPRIVALRPDKAFDKTIKNTNWYLYINEQIESDL